MAMKTALITGAAQGIGRAIATRLARDGFKVCITDLESNSTNAMETIAMLNKIHNGNKDYSSFFPADSSIKEQVFGAVRSTFDKMGGFDVMINNAGIAILGEIATIKTEDWVRISNVNVLGTLYGIQAAAQLFKELEKPGKIINAGSVGAIEGAAKLGCYSASKHAVKALTQTAAKELAPNNITVNAYCPGITKTDMWKSIDEMSGDYSGKTRAALIASITKGIPLGRPTEVEDVAGLVSFLASSDSDYITGQSIIVSGGSLLR